MTDVLSKLLDFENRQNAEVIDTTKATGEVNGRKVSATSQPTSPLGFWHKAAIVGVSLVLIPVIHGLLQGRISIWPPKKKDLSPQEMFDKCLSGSQKECDQFLKEAYPALQGDKSKEYDSWNFAKECAGRPDDFCTSIVKNYLDREGFKQLAEQNVRHAENLANMCLSQDNALCREIVKIAFPILLEKGSGHEFAYRCSLKGDFTNELKTFDPLVIPALPSIVQHYAKLEEKIRNVLVMQCSCNKTDKICDEIFQAALKNHDFAKVKFVEYCLGADHPICRIAVKEAVKNLSKLSNKDACLFNAYCRATVDQDCMQSPDITALTHTCESRTNLLRFWPF